MTEKPTTWEECQELEDELKIDPQLIAEACGIRTPLDAEFEMASDQTSLWNVFKKSPAGSMIEILSLNAYARSGITEKEDREALRKNTSSEALVKQRVLGSYLGNATTQEERIKVIENTSGEIREKALEIYLYNATDEEEVWYVVEMSETGSLIGHTALRRIIESL